MKTTLYVLAIVQLAFASTSFADSDKKQTIPDLAMAKQYAKAQLEIEKIRASKTPDWAAASVQFELMLPIVKYIDAKCEMQYDKEIRDALKECTAGHDIETNDEILGKGLQHIAVLAIRQELDLMAADPNNIKPCAERIAAYFEGIRPTFVRRDKGFFEGKKTLEASADEALTQLSKADKSSLLTASMQLEDVIARTYALSMLYEISEIEKMRSSDVALCDGKRTEAKMFYRIIQQRIEKRSPKINEIIVNTLNGSYDTMNSQSLEKDLVTALGFKLR
ncbi:MAG: hypothetical protein ABSE89_11565 [Sedimentisphaerales bacterium]